ncbi:MAG TPA: GNAT family N-acetyltransferase [Longilinea sp.]|nr:GNAT family N-acetyltransferase [Longilinea sp.]
MLQIEFKDVSQLDPTEKAQAEEVDSISFKTLPADPAIAWVEWDGPTALFLGKLDGRVVSVIDILKRGILVDAKPVQVVGVGGVATHPDFRRRGYASMLIDAAGSWIRRQTDCSFGMLFCARELLVYYGRSGWIEATNPLYIEQKGERLPLNSPKMVLPVGGAIWPMGEVDIQGKPW